MESILTLMVRDGSEQVQVSEWIWRSWTGRRFKDGAEYFGPVYTLGSDDVYRA